MIKPFKYLKLSSHNYVFTLSVFTIVLAGVFARLIGLGTHPFSIDEYYLYKSINLIQESGLPEFLCGGYYARGILLQYLILPFTSFIDNQELATRLPIVLFSILTFPAIYLIGRDMGSRYIGILALFLFSFSIWQIEFARFARMYAPFQMLFVWQVLLFINPNLPSRNINILLNGIIACIAILFYEGGIFCLALAFFNLLLHKNSAKIVNYTPTFIATILSGLMIGIPFRHLGTNNEPNVMNKPDPSGYLNNLPIDLPEYFIYQNYSHLLLIILIAYLIITVLFLLKHCFNSEHTIFTKLILFFTAVSVLSNQFFLTACLLITALLLPVIRNDIIKISTNRFAQIYLLTTLFWVFACLVNFVIYTDTHSFIAVAKNLFNYFFSYPDVFFDIYRQWQKPMPIHSVLCVLCILYAVAWCLIKPSLANNKIRYLLSILISIILLIAIINTPYNTSRYSFFISPLVLIVVSYCIFNIASLLNKNTILMPLIICILTITFLNLSEDFRYSHLANIDSYESNHRVNYSTQYAKHLYPRYDYYSITNFININANKDDAVIVTTPVLEMYINNDIDINYFITRENNEFDNHSSCEGKQELWSRRPLIDNYDELYKILRQGTHTKWLVLHGERGNPFTTNKHEALKEKAQLFSNHTNGDKTLTVYRIDPEISAF